MIHQLEWIWQGAIRLLCPPQYYPSAGQLPSLDSLCTRARELVEEFPLQKGRVEDGRTTSPKWDVWCGDELDRGMNRAVYDKSLLDLVSFVHYRRLELLTYLLLSSPHLISKVSFQANSGTIDLCDWHPAASPGESIGFCLDTSRTSFRSFDHQPGHLRR
jgi:hypothetical protein